MYVAILGLVLVELRGQAREDLEARMTQLARASAGRFDAAFREIAASTATAARLTEIDGDVTEPQVFADLVARVQGNAGVYGAATAFEPGTMPSDSRLYCPYVYRDKGGGLERMFISEDVYDWHGDDAWQWYREPARTGEPVWSDPYFDEGAGNVLMVTYSAPFFRDDRIWGVTTADVLLPALRELVGADLGGEVDFVIVTGEGRFVFSPATDDIMRRTIFDLADARGDGRLRQLGERMTAGEAGTAVVAGAGGDDTFAYFAPIRSTGWSLAAQVPEREALAGVRTQVRNAALALGLTLVLILACLWFAAGRIARPIERLRAGVQEVSAGNLSAAVEGVDRGDEIGELAGSFNRMTRDLRANLDRLAAERAAREKIERDLDLAREIQQGLLPGEAPSVPGYQIAGWNQPADQTGGDFYDWLALPDGRLVVTLADVSGHGIGPALIVAVYRAYLRASTSHDVDLHAATDRMNALLGQDMPFGKFVTAAVGVLDPAANRMALISAGQAPLYFYEAATHTVHVWEADTLPLGIVPDLECDGGRDVAFAPGDALVLLTDGFYEYMSPDQQLYGSRRVADFVREHVSTAPAEFIRLLHADVLAFADGAPQGDDLTAVVIRRDDA